MAKDYFQDIVPPPGDNVPVRKLRPATIDMRPAEPVEPANTADSEEYCDDDISNEDTTPAPARGIRNINMPPRSRSRTAMGEMRSDMREVPPVGRGMPPRPRRNFSRRWLWALVAACIIIIGFLALFMFRSTTITLTPRTQTVSFDQTSQFTAYPAASAATGTLSYTVAVTDLTDSEAVQGNGTTETQMKASGSITVYNNYSAASVKLIKNTRFQTPAGLIFRAPSDIVVPGKSGSTPGHVTVTVVADQTGPQYNIGPTSRFTIPGLQSTAAMYANIYAQSTGSMTGGFSGSQEGVSASARQAAVSDIRARLVQKAAQYVQSQNTPTTVAFSGLTEIGYTDMPDTSVSSSTQVQINETAHVQAPVFRVDSFNATVAQTMAVDTGNTPVTLVGGTGYGAQATDSTPVSLGTDSLDFSLLGKAEFIWSIDTKALTQALAGRDQSVFQTVIGGFPGIEGARARIEPFWKSSFPSDPAKIKVIVESVGATSTPNQP